jgi:4-amino-4-deoxy-L-arabinose transferase-like glycosyltransferase
VADPNRLDTESMPMTEPYKPTFDTGIHQKVEPELFEPDRAARRRRFWRRRAEPTPTEAPAEVPVTDDVPAVDPYHYLKWWQFLLVLLAVWVPAGGIGAGFFYWWSHDNSRHKTAVVFVVLAFVVVSAVAGLILAMVPDRPLVSALAIAVISAVFAAAVGAAPVYGKFYCEHSQRHCLLDVLPY